MSYEFPFSSQNSKGTIVLTVSRATKGYYEGPVVSYPFAQPFRKFPVLWVQFDLKITNFIFCCQKHTIIQDKQIEKCPLLYPQFDRKFTFLASTFVDFTCLKSLYNSKLPLKVNTKCSLSLFSPKNLKSSFFFVLVNAKTSRSETSIFHRKKILQAQETLQIYMIVLSTNSQFYIFYKKNFSHYKDPSSQYVLLYGKRMSLCQ